MSSAGPVTELLLRWEDLRARGRSASAEELCEGRPELLDEVRRRIRVLEAAYQVPNQAASCAETRTDDRTRTEVAPPRLAGYEVLGMLGRGGMGVVYQARHVTLNRPVALKLVSAGAHAAEVERARFRREAEAVARLQHPHIVQIYEIGEQDGCPYLALEYVNGGSLAQALQGNPLPAGPAARLVESLARAVHYAHSQGIVHRDLKPANILIQKLTTESAESAERMTEEGRRGGSAGGGPSCSLPSSSSAFPSALSALSVVSFIPKIADFGLARFLDAEAGQTRTGSILGTPSYMAPEQAEGRPREVGPLTDVYALGALLYELLTGRPPFRGTSLLETLEQVRSEEPVPPSYLQPKLPRDLEAICLKCLQKEPGRRYASAEALADDLGRFLAGEPVRAQSGGLVEHLARTLNRSQDDVKFAAWGNLVLVIAPLPFLLQLFLLLLGRLGMPVPPAGHLAVPSTPFLGLAVLYLGDRLRAGAPRGPAARQLWSVLLGHALAVALTTVICLRTATPEQPLGLELMYPLLAVHCGLTWFILGGTYWGRFYLFGLAFFVLALFMPLFPGPAPLVFTFSLSATFAAVGLRLRRFRDPATQPE